MSLTVYLDDDDEARVERLAARWQVSKRSAVLRAIREADVDAVAIAEEGSERYAEALEELGHG